MSDLNAHVRANVRSREIWRLVHRAERGEISEVRQALRDMGHEAPDGDVDLRELLVQLAGAACETLARVMLGLSRD